MHYSYLPNVNVNSLHAFPPHTGIPLEQINHTIQCSFCFQIQRYHFCFKRIYDFIFIMTHIVDEINNKKIV